jgi:glycosyltransferase involved in cell wall biosynthesis
MRPTVCLNMIVKNEAHVIDRCLRSVRELIDFWVIVDTGSSDGTPDAIADALTGIPGELHHAEWKDFGTNRTQALELARGKCDYVLIIDADEEMHVPAGFSWPQLDRDAYQLLHSQASHDAVTFWRISVMRNSRSWRYVGVLHEYPTCDGQYSQARICGPRVQYHLDGARSQIEVREKYAADARTLENALKHEPDNARYVFYLAQSYRDSEQLDKAAKAYERRAEMEDWVEETWYSLFQMAMLAERRNLDEATVVNYYLRAHEYRPTRAEALGNLARYMRERRRFASARVFAAAALKIPLPDDALFLDSEYYSWRCLDELSIADYWLGNYRNSAAACRKLLRTTAVPDEHKPRIADNLNFALAHLNAPRTTRSAKER